MTYNAIAIVARNEKRPHAKPFKGAATTFVQ